MGGSAKQIEKDVKRSSIGQAGAYVQDKGSEVIEGAKEHGGAIVTGVGQGLGKLGTEAMAGLKHNLDQVASVFMPQDSGGSQEAQSASANYSGSSKRSKSGAKKKGDLEAGEIKGATGKQKLYARRKTATA